MSFWDCTHGYQRLKDSADKNNRRSIVAVCFRPPSVSFSSSLGHSAMCKLTNYIGFSCSCYRYTKATPWRWMSAAETFPFCRKARPNKQTNIRMEGSNPGTTSNDGTAVTHPRGDTLMAVMHIDNTRCNVHCGISNVSGDAADIKRRRKCNCIPFDACHAIGLN